MGFYDFIIHGWYKFYSLRIIFYFYKINSKKFQIKYLSSNENPPLDSVRLEAKMRCGFNIASGIWVEQILAPTQSKFLLLKNIKKFDKLTCLVG